MKFVLLAALMLSGCLTTYDTDRSQDLCTNVGMGYEGFTITGTNKGQHVGHVRCVSPETDEQKCAVTKAQAELREKESYNSRWWSKRLLVGVGYAFYVLPGYLLYELWNDDANADYNETNQRIVEVKSSIKCDAVAH